MKTIKQKAEAYDEALKKAKVFKEHLLEINDDGYADEINNIFPELAESEDEKIKKDLIQYINEFPDIIWRGHFKEDIIAWLEKKCLHLENYDEAEKEKTDFVDDVFIECHADFLDFKEGNTYWLEYIGDDKDNVRRDNLLGKTYHITPCQLYTVFKKLTWLEKLIDQKSPEESLRVSSKEYIDIVNECIYDESKPTNKIVLKFREGEWIVRNAERFKHNKYLIKEVKDYYVCEDLKGRRVTFTFDDAHKNFKLWNISDAKNGDVLNSPSHRLIWIYKDNEHYHVCVNMNYVTKNVSTDGLIKIPSDVCPATKNEWTILFEKTKEAGLEFNFDKSGLKKIEEKPTNNVGPKFEVGNWYQCTKDFFGKGVTFDKNTAYYCAKEGCLQNEYGCHIAIVKDLYDNFKLWTISDAKDGDVLVVGDEDGTGTAICGKNDKYGNNILYCYYDNENGFVINTPIALECLIHPATKEQCDLFFQKMKEAGYEWDAENKKVKKIE